MPCLWPLHTSLQRNVPAALAALAAVAVRRRHADAGLALGHGGRALGLEPELTLGRSQREETGRRLGRVKAVGLGLGVELRKVHTTLVGHTSR